MARPHRRRILAADKGELRKIAEHADQSVMQADIDEPALAGARALVKRGEHRLRPEHAANHVAERYAEFDRHMAALAVDAERARQRLRDNVEGRLVAQRPTEAKAADRAVDEARVDLRQRRVAEPEALHDAGAVVLDQDVGLSD